MQQPPNTQKTVDSNQRRAWVTPSIQKMAAGDAESGLLIGPEIVVLLQS